MKNILTRDNFIKYMDSRFQWVPFFKLTNLCNFSCMHCCEKSGPNADPAFIRISDIKAILDTFSKSPRTMKIATITGGEPMTAYDKVSDNYIPNVLSAAAKRGYIIELKTNGAWAIGKKSEQIFSDINNILVKYPKIIMAYHLSLDKYHPYSDITTARIIKWFVENKNVIPDSLIHIFYDDYHRLADMMVDMAGRDNILVDFEADTPEKFKSLPIWKIRDHNRFLCTEQYHCIDNIGRAKDNNIGTKTTGLLDILNSTDTVKPIMFDAVGNATLFACNDFGITTPYHDKNGNVKKLFKIKSELFAAAYRQYLIESQMR